MSQQSDEPPIFSAVGPDPDAERDPSLTDEQWNRSCERWGCDGDHKYHWHNPETGELESDDEV